MFNTNTRSISITIKGSVPLRGAWTELSLLGLDNHSISYFAKIIFYARKKHFENSNTHKNTKENAR